MLYDSECCTMYYYLDILSMDEVFKHHVKSSVYYVIFICLIHKKLKYFKVVWNIRLRFFN